MTYPDPDVIEVMRDIALSRSVQLTDDALNQLAIALARLRQNQSMLLDRLDNGEISDDQYLEKLNERLSDYVGDVVRITSREVAERLLDDPDLQVDWLVDKQTFSER